MHYMRILIGISFMLLSQIDIQGGGRAYLTSPGHSLGKVTPAVIKENACREVKKIVLCGSVLYIELEKE